MSREECDFMANKIKELLTDGSIKEVDKSHPKGWLSNIFLVPKSDGGFHMILNMKLHKIPKVQNGPYQSGTSINRTEHGSLQPGHSKCLQPCLHNS